MLSKSRIKLITSLKQKKYRNKHQLFVVEGLKTIKEFLDSHFELDFLYTTQHFENVKTTQQGIITEKELQKISFLQQTNSALAIFKMDSIVTNQTNNLTVALDNVRDPGNLGTIIRLCDWFGISQLICNTETVDCYNPKVIQATMGSLTRVQVSYTNLDQYLQNQAETTIFGAFMDGENIYTIKETNLNGIIVLGNEANGISSEIEKHITKRISIPRFGALKATESLNVAMATSILLSEFKRRTI